MCSDTEKCPQYILLEIGKRKKKKNQDRKSARMSVVSLKKKKSLGMIMGKQNNLERYTET